MYWICNISFKVLITVQINERKIIFFGHISTDSSHGGSAASSNLGSADKIKELVKSFTELHPRRIKLPFVLAD